MCIVYVFLRIESKWTVNTTNMIALLMNMKRSQTNYMILVESEDNDVDYLNYFTNNKDFPTNFS